MLIILIFLFFLLLLTGTKTRPTSAAKSSPADKEIIEKQSKEIRELEQKIKVIKYLKKKVT